MKKLISFLSIAIVAFFSFAFTPVNVDPVESSTIEIYQTDFESPTIEINQTDFESLGSFELHIYTSDIEPTITPKTPEADIAHWRRSSGNLNLAYKNPEIHKDKFRYKQKLIS